MNLKISARSRLNRGLGFTLVELLVVIAIIAVLAAVVVLIINPLELTRRSRDAARLTDLANLQQAINVAAQEATTSGTAILCAGGSYDATAKKCAGSSNSGDASVRKPDGSGWVKVDLGNQKSVSVPTLPIDPGANDVTYHYTYCSDGSAWEIDAKLESDQQSPKMKNTADGGDDDALYEVGSNLTLTGTDAGAKCAY